ncbi:hypothetical protein GGI23_005048, partial [Coemansia sp. RSA 2559]
MYPLISSFVQLVAHFVQQELLATKTDTEECRLILPYEKTDSNPDGADDDTRVDLCLRAREVGSPVGPQANLRYTGMVCVFEVKRGSRRRDFVDARVQLLDYSRNIYANQCDRRFLWGLTCCGKIVNAYIVNNHRIYSSPSMNVAESSGRKEFIRLLVGWSLCTRGQLGFDETI